MSAHSDCADKTRNKHAPYIESDGFFLDEGRSVRKKECGDMEIIKRILPMYRCSLRLGFALAAGVVVAASVADARIRPTIRGRHSSLSIRPKTRRCWGSDSLQHAMSFRSCVMTPRRKIPFAARSSTLSLTEH